MYVCMSPFSFCMFFGVCECEHRYVDVGQQGEKDLKKKKEKGEKEIESAIWFWREHREQNKKLRVKTERNTEKTERIREQT